MAVHCLSAEDVTKVNCCIKTRKYNYPHPPNVTAPQLPPKNCGWKTILSYYWVSVTFEGWTVKLWGGKPSRQSKVRSALVEEALGWQLVSKMLSSQTKKYLKISWVHERHSPPRALLRVQWSTATAVAFRRTQVTHPCATVNLGLLQQQL